MHSISTAYALYCNIMCACKTAWLHDVLYVFIISLDMFFWFLLCYVWYVLFLHKVMTQVNPPLIRSFHRYMEHWNMLPSHHHGKASIGQLGSKFTLACLRVLDLTQEVGESNTIVAWLTSLSRVLHAELTLTRTTSSSGGRRLEESSCLNQTSEGDDLSTTKHWQP